MYRASRDSVIAPTGVGFGRKKIQFPTQQTSNIMLTYAELSCIILSEYVYSIQWAVKFIALHATQITNHCFNKGDNACLGFRIGNKRSV